MGENQQPNNPEGEVVIDLGHSVGSVTAESARTVFETVFAGQETNGQEQIADLLLRLTALMSDDENRAIELITALALDQDVRSLDESEPDFTPEFGTESEAFLRTLRATFGPQIASAGAAFAENPLNWKNVWFTPRWHAMDEAWELELRIARFDDVSFQLVGPPVSYLRIITYLQENLAALELASDVYGEDELSNYDNARSTFEESLLNAQQADEEVVEGGDHHDAV